MYSYKSEHAHKKITVTVFYHVTLVLMFAYFYLWYSFKHILLHDACAILIKLR